MLNPIKSTDFSGIRLKVASPDVIKNWSFGEITKPETINYRTQRPEKDGLFDERIFGPSKDWECYCGKYKKIRYKGIVCDKCGVEVTRSVVRRERMGHIDLAVPVSHIWFLRGVPSRLGLLLDMSMQNIEKIVYFASFVITEVDEELKKTTLSDLKDEYKKKRNAIKADYKQRISQAKDNGKEEKEIQALEDEQVVKLEELDEIFVKSESELKSIQYLQIISEREYHDLSFKYGHIFSAGIGAEAIRVILRKLDLGAEIKVLEKELAKSKQTKRAKLLKRIKLFKSLYANNIKPDWMILDRVPVIPPDLRPMVPLDGGRYASHDLNDLYRRVINRNNRLKQLLDLKAPEVITRNEKRMLQEAVDALIDNSARAGKTVTASTGQKRQLKSLADMLKGKQGRFRQNLLGKRTDYSGRSVIVVGPHLKLHECGLPKKMALELFRPFIISKLIELELVHNVRSGNRFIESKRPEVWDILDEIIAEAYVFLNRAPTLHRLGIQAFKPILIEGKAIQVHPLVCSAFNADFDGDQMAVHVPLTQEARKEADQLMLASRNLLKPSTGEPIAGPTQDIVWGIYYLTYVPDEEATPKKFYGSQEEAIMAYNHDAIHVQDRITVRMNDSSRLDTTVGRLLFNQALPDEVEFINRTLNSKALKVFVQDYYSQHGEEATAKLLDDMKVLGFGAVTKSGLSWGMDDLPALEEKKKLLADSEEKVLAIQEQYEDGFLTEDERYMKTIEIWTDAREKITGLSRQALPIGGTVFSMIESGARGSWGQLTQMVGMKGLVANPAGETIELPVKSNFKEGFTVLEYFISTHGARKGTTDTALRTANAGYLTRRLVDVAQEIVVQIEDCGTTSGFTITKEESEEMNKTLAERCWGRFVAEPIKDKKGKVVVDKDVLIDKAMVAKIEKADPDEVILRSAFECNVRRGICQKCYGYDLGHNRLVDIGTAVGIIAAQSIGEPGTQLTMRTFHSGGVAGADITQGLPRVEEIFEVRNPKKKAILSEVDGKVKLEETAVIQADADKETITQQVIKITYKGESEAKYFFGTAKKKEKATIKVKEGDEVSKGTVLFVDPSGEEVVSERSGRVVLHEKYIGLAYMEDKLKEYLVPVGFQVWVKDGEKVTKGQQLTEGSIDLRELYKLRNNTETQKYIIREIQHIYSTQGQKLNDKHLEVIVRQMFSRMKVADGGDTSLVIGEVLEKAELNDENEKLTGKGKPAEGEEILQGITKVSLTTSSFLSAASFQETQKVLIKAAISGKVDKLEGLKENVIIGRLIPAGTGFNVEPEAEEEAPAAEEEVESGEETSAPEADTAEASEGNAETEVPADDAAPEADVAESEDEASE